MNWVNKRILLDSNLPVDFRFCLSAYPVETARYAGLNLLDDGRLLDAMAGRYDVLVTADASIAYQQNMSGRSVALVVLSAKSNRILDLLPLVPALLSVISAIQPGEVREITAP